MKSLQGIAEELIEIIEKEDVYVKEVYSPIPPKGVVMI